jgi:starch-binding outer membrane protein SusE/F
MKNNIVKILGGFILISCVLIACKKQIPTITYQGGTQPALGAASLSDAVLLKLDEKNNWNTFSWTNPDYKFSTGPSSQDVTYTLQFDTTGSNFTNPNLQEIVISKELSRVVTVKEINTILAKLGLAENIPHNVEIRLKSSLTNSSAALFSNVLKTILTPYLDVAVPLPSTGELYLVGDATAGGWDNPVPIPSQKFTKVNTTTFEITAPLNGGKEYLLLPLNGDWGHKYAVKDKTVSGLNTGGDFGFDQKDNFPGPSSSGTYKITVDFKIGKFTVTKL